MAWEGNAVDDVRDAVVAVTDAAPGSRTSDGATKASCRARAARSA